jgi:hypothetical protein
MTPYCLIGSYQSFTGTCYLHLQFSSWGNFVVVVVDDDDDDDDAGNRSCEILVYETATLISYAILYY